MKVFISWSGDKSHKIAKIFREWIPSVIQSVEPYVSSEDIDKGARWSTDIAKELADSTFGILCVTKENLNAPWLCFEAGALSKTIDKSYVNPFLFDIKRSEINGPILQFQSTIFEKEDIKKLIITLNTACTDNGISSKRLEKSFEVWYPTLETELNKIKEENISDSESYTAESTSSSDILEEILDLSRENQKLLRNSDSYINDSINALSKMLSNSLPLYEHGIEAKRTSKRYKVSLLDEIIHMARNCGNKTSSFLILISFFKEDCPWIYYMGKELIDILNSQHNLKEKHKSINNFKNMLDFTINHPIMREIYGNKKEYIMLTKELSYILMDYC